MTTTSTETPMNPGLIPILEDQVLELADHEAWLDAQIREMEFANSHDRSSISSDDRSTEEIKKELEQRIDILKEELVRAASMESIRAKVVDRSLAKAIEERDEAVSQFLHIHKELQQIRQDLSATQVQVLDCQDNNRKLAQILSEETAAMKEATTSQDSGSNRRMNQRMDEELQNINIKHNVISNVLQGLLLESGVDWANDPHYLDVMLKLSE
ncbi:hypothetical protein BGX27_007733 [Mortierella sp. AM989]|nr:hypothetical protein BGX27_007733 [Mortierella sp. AM989]